MGDDDDEDTFTLINAYKARRWIDSNFTLAPPNSLKSQTTKRVCHASDGTVGNEQLLKIKIYTQIS